MLSLVIPSSTVPVSDENEVIAGALGATVSTVTAKTGEATLVLPATSVALAVKLWLPFGNGLVVKPQAPLPFAVVVPSWFVAVEHRHRAVGRRACRPESSVLSLVIPSSHRASVRSRTR